MFPEDTVAFEYHDTNSLLIFVEALHNVGHPFVVSPAESIIAMSNAAAREIGAI